jgi:primosomal protein N' (replication factor Y)
VYADVILPFALEKNYTYLIPDEMVFAIRPGTRVEVPFRNKIYTGIIAKTHAIKPEGYETKPILSLPDHLDVVNKTQLELWDWIASYYMCSVGDVMNAALPAPYKLSSETILVFDENAAIDNSQLNDKEYIVTEALTLQREISLSDVQKILQQKSVQPVIKSLIQKGIAYVKEELKDEYKPRKEKFILLTPQYNDEEKLKELFDKLEKNEKQLNILMTWYQLQNKEGKVKKAVLLRRADATPAILKTMIKNGIFEEADEAVSRLKGGTFHVNDNFVLTENQKSAIAEIRNLFTPKNTVLLHGVTGSGKTEIYIELIKEYAEAGKQVLYLLPEIALTAQIINRLKKRFGNHVGVYHSKFSQNERIEIWNRVLSSEFKIILGARSALFLPFHNLGLVIIDEEHDYSYKQFEPAPRYHARDTAIFLAHLHKAKTLLGTATPSIEAYHHAKTGKYGLVKLYERYAGMQMPEIDIIDIKQEKEKHLMHSHFSSVLINKIKLALSNKEQVILFQNRRGYAPYLHCESCGWVPKCVQCDVNLVYHKFDDELRCHYCGYKHKTFPACPACASTRITIQGFGTEKIEDELQLLLSEKKIARLDLDAVRTKHGHEKIIREFEDGEIDILVGTQMISKGLDFDNVSLVGIMSADQIINFSNFRSHERAFQMITQVSGRAGRKNKKGYVVIQTYQPAHPVLTHVVQNDFDDFYSTEILQRRNFIYPPFARLIQLTFKHKKPDVVSRAATILADILKKDLKQGIFGPTVPGIPRIRNQYLMQLLIKSAINKTAVETVKQIIKKGVAELYSNHNFRKIHVIIDVDPY